MTTYDRIKNNIVEQLGVEPEDVVPEARFKDDLGTDSLDEVELVMAIEEEFDLEIDDADAETVRTVAEAVALVDRLVSENGVKK